MIDPSNGELTPTGQNPPAAHQSPTRVASDKYGYRLYAINATSNDLNAYFIDRRNGYLYATPGSPFLIGAKPEDLRVHPSGRFVYITAQKNLIYAFAVEPDGSLMMVPGSPFSTQMDPRGLAITPDGRYLYVSNYSPGLIDAFSINEVDGALTPVPGSPYTPQPVGASVARPELSRSHRTQLANS